MTPHDTTPEDPRPQDSLHDDVFADATREPDGPAHRSTPPTSALPTSSPATASGAGARTTTTAPAGAAVATEEPGSTASGTERWLRGPAPFAVVLGLLGLLVAGAVLLTELTDVRFPWADLGPWTVVAAGLVVVLVGAIGLRSSRRAQD
jgi:hypothetical protein